MHFVARRPPIAAPAGRQAWLQGRFAVDIEAIKAQLADLVRVIEDKPEDSHELFLQLHEKLNEIRAFGMPVPQDLLDLERALEAEFKAARR